jgi:DNA-binding winged helix-turn-helix (wHTH) protein
MKDRAAASRSGLEHIVYIFEGFRLDAGRRQLSSSGGVVVPLNSRAMEALLLLVSNAGELVSKKQLLDGVWPSAVVEDNNINQCILAIRKALGENAGSNRFIMTVTGRGYRFVAPVIQQTRESADITTPDVPRRKEGRSLRVLAFPAIAVAIILAVIASGRSRGTALPQVEPGELVVHLRSSQNMAVPGANALLACLLQRPDLHLQVEVHLVGSDMAQPVWTGQYLAGAQDLAQDAVDITAQAAACEQIASH